MPRYIYSAKTQPDKITQSTIEAESEQDAVNKLTEMGYFPISVESEVISLDKQKSLAFKKIPSRDLVMFTRQLSSLIESGVNIINSLTIISNQTNNKYLKAILNDITSQVKDGKSLLESFSSHPKLFSPLYSAMIQTGESSGRLNETLRRLAEYLEKEQEFKDSLRAALVYPIFICFVGIGTVLVLLMFVIPRLVTMFEDMGQVLPLPTRILIDTSHFLRNWSWIILVVIILAVFFLRRLYENPRGRLSFDTFKLKLAVFGEIILKTEISRLMRTLSLLISSSVPITSALETSESILQNQILKAEVERFKEQIKNGYSFSSSLKESKFFPEFVSNIIVIGEETGVLDKSLMRIADDYEREVDRTLKNLTRLLEPVIILVMGLIVGFIVLSMLLPIFQINLIVR